MVETEDGSFDTKCGEIFFEADGRFFLVCYACNEQFYKYHAFEKHIIRYHLPNDLKYYVNMVEVAHHAPTESSDPETILHLVNDDEDKSNYSKETDDKSVKVELEDVGSTNSSFKDDNMVTDICYKPITYISNNYEYQSAADNPSDISEYHTETIQIHKENTEEERQTTCASGKIIETKQETLNIKDNIFKCPLCMKNFLTNRSLKTHMHIHSEERPFKCTMCPQAFKNRANLHTHKRSHLGDKRFSCDFCGKKFIRNSERLVHMRTHTGEKPYQCDECGLRFTTSGLLHEHRKRHSNTRNYQCEICLKRFYNKELLKNHQISHSTDKPFECRTCFKTFSRKKNLTAHEKIHSEVKEYICELCGKAFAQGPGLICHMKKHR